MNRVNKVIVIGLGSAGKRHVDCLQRMGISVQGFDINMGIDDIDFLKDHAKDQVIVIATPNQCHYEQAIVALEYGARALLIEKPPTVSANEMALLHEKTMATGAKVYFAFNYRFHSKILRFRQMYHQFFEKLNLLQFTAFEDVTEWPNYKRDGWIAGQYGGHLLTSAIHSLDLAIHLLGPVKEIKNQRSVMYYDDRIADSDCGILGSLIHCENQAETRLNMRWTNKGNKTIYFHMGQDMLAMDMNLDPEQTHEMYMAQMKAFLNAVMGQVPTVPLCSTLDALAVMQAVELIRKTAFKEKIIA